MKLPRDISGDELAKSLESLGYQVTRQTGSHMRLTTTEGGEHHVTTLCALALSQEFWMMWRRTLKSVEPNY